MTSKRELLCLHLPYCVVYTHLTRPRVNYGKNLRRPNKRQALYEDEWLWITRTLIIDVPSVTETVVERGRVAK